MIWCEKGTILSKGEIKNYLKLEQEEEVVVPSGEELENASQKLLAIFKLIFKGDCLASQYLLSNILSKVHSRESAMPLGQFNINITNLSQEQAKQISALLDHIMPLHLKMMLTTESMSEMRF